MTIQNTDYGIIAFLDVLGYSSFVANSTTTEASKIISEILLRLKKTSSDKYLGLFKAFKDKNLEEIGKKYVDKIRWLVFSDTIVIILPYEEDLSGGGKTEGFYWFNFIVQCGIIYSDLFAQGLPVRGVVTCGEYYLSENCFAGRGVIEAYENAQDLDLAAIALSETAVNKLNTMEYMGMNGLEAICGAFVTKHLIPQKNKTERKGYLLSSATKSILDSKDLRQFVVNSFMKHNKDIPHSAFSKVENTEMFFRAIKARDENKGKVAGSGG